MTRLALLTFLIALTVVAPAQATLVPQSWKDGHGNRRHVHVRPAPRPVAPPAPMVAARAVAAPAASAAAAPASPAASPASAVTPVASAASAPAAASAQSAELSAAERELLGAVNQARAAAGLGAVSIDANLQTAARAHTQNLLDNGAFTHDFLEDGTSVGFSAWIRRYYRGTCAGENLASGSPSLSAAQAVALWLNSPGHRANMLSSRFTTIGVALVGRNGTVVATTDFGGC